MAVGGIMILTLERIETSNEGTFGKLYNGDELVCHTVELPWRSNRTQVSCIPCGIYKCGWHGSKTFPTSWIIKDVPKRDGILIHPGNWAGDIAQGFISDSQGCILLGMSKGKIRGQKAISDSRGAMDKFDKLTGKRPFELHITGICG